jgi:beta-phosphoglucomutase family hydrolase
MLGLPDGVTTCLFDLDGVLTDTASVHQAAWREMFDAFLRERSQRDRDEAAFQPFTSSDYEEYVDGKPRLDGVRDFLASRDITLPEGSADDPADADTVNGLGRRKNDIVLRRLHDDGVTVFQGSLRYLQAATDLGLRRAVVSASANAQQVLDAAGLSQYLEVRVDGITIKDQQLRGKPSPETYLYAALQLGVPPAQCAVFEDALSGVAAGRAGGFGYVVGVDRVGQSDALTANGADVVVTDLGDLLDSR